MAPSARLERATSDLEDRRSTPLSYEGVKDEQCCVVPFCSSTRDRVAPFEEWICGEHWKPIPKEWRQIWGRYAGTWRRFGPPPGASAAALRVWSALKRCAIERGAGI